jgi:ribose transport system substrate-binding protein
MHQVPWRFAAPAAIAALALAAAGCGSTTTNSASVTGSSRGGTQANALPASCKKARPVLGVALPNTVNPYYVAMRQSFLDNAKRAGFDVKLAIANDSDSNQLNQITSFVQQQVRAVALNAVNSGPGAASVALLNRAKIPVFTVNVIVSPSDLKLQKAHIQQYVGADQVEGGKMMGEAALKDLGANAKITYGIVGDPEQIPTNQRDSGFKAALKANPNARFVGVVNSKVDPQVSLSVASDMLQGNPDMNVVFADTGPGAVGSIQAIKQLKRQGKTALYAFCAADTPLDSTLYGGCAAQEPADYARIVVDNVAKYVKQGATVPQEILRPLKVFSEGQKPGAGEVG